MKNLKQISLDLNYPTDKDTYHNYMPIYQNELDKTENIKLLELGVYTGGSLRLWQEYFEKSEIHGVECTNHDQTIIIPGIMHWGKYEDVYEEFEDNYFDYIINDSMHDATSQIHAFKLYYSKLKLGGKFFMEDIINENELNIIVNSISDYNFKIYNMNDTSDSKDSIVVVVYK